MVFVSASAVSSSQCEGVGRIRSDKLNITAALNIWTEVYLVIYWVTCISSQYTQKTKGLKSEKSDFFISILKVPVTSIFMINKKSIFWKDT